MKSLLWEGIFHCFVLGACSEQLEENDGLQVLFSSVCSCCSHTTFAVKGDFHSVLKTVLGKSTLLQADYMVHVREHGKIN